MITSILTVYNRPYTLNEQIKSIKNQTINSNIMVWINASDQEAPEITDNDIIVSKCTHNLKFYSRFAYALNAQTEYVAIFDDDTIPGKRWFENCLQCIKEKPGIYGTVGVELLGDGYRKRKRYGWPSMNEEIKQVHLVGHGWFMKTEYLKYLWMEKPQTFDNGEDMQLSYMAKKYGNINTYAAPHPENDKELWGSLKAIEYGADKNASFNVNQKAYLNIRDNIARNFLKKGWVL